MRINRRLLESKLKKVILEVLDGNSSANLESIIDAWQSEKKKIAYEGVFNIDELLPYKEYEHTRDTSRSGIAKSGGSDLSGTAKWDTLKADMEKNGWDSSDPLWLAIGRNGVIKVAEGNHRLAIAQEIGIKQIPVKFEFRDSVYMTTKSDYDPEYVAPEKKSDTKPRNQDSAPKSKKDLDKLYSLL